VRLLRDFITNLDAKGGVVMEERKEQFSSEEQKKLLEEVRYIFYELLSDNFAGLGIELRKLRRRFDAMWEAFNRFCDKHDIDIDY